MSLSVKMVQRYICPSLIRTTQRTFSKSLIKQSVVGKYVNRYDVTILVNGLPLIQVELKRRGIDIREAVNQVMRYKKHSYNGLYHFIQLFIVSNGVDTKYFANSDRDLMYSLAFFWTDFNNVRITNLKDFSISFLARDHIIKMLTRYTILNDTDKILMVMRPYDNGLQGVRHDRVSMTDDLLMGIPVRYPSHEKQLL